MTFKILGCFWLVEVCMVEGMERVDWLMDEHEDRQANMPINVT